MVGEVGVHDDYEVAGAVLQAVDVGCAEAELAFSGVQVDAAGVGFCELVGDELRAVWGGVVDDYEFPVEVSGMERVRNGV